MNIVDTSRQYLGWIHTRLWQYRLELIVMVVMVSIATTLYYYAFYRMVFLDDYLFHMEFALSIKAQQLKAAHFIYHLSGLIVDWLFPQAKLLDKGILAVFPFVIATYGFLYLLIYTQYPAAYPYRRALVAGVMALALMLVTPITLISWHEQRMYFGYIGISTYHNPTILATKPFSLLLGFYTAQLVYGKPVRIDVLALLAMLSGLAKPNYLISILPAIGVISLFQLLRWKKILWLRLSFGILIPTLFVLGWLFLYTYIFEIRDGASLSFALAEVVLWFSGSYTNMVVFFFLSILFPLSVLLLHFRESFHDDFFAFSLVTFIFGAGSAYFLIEEGERKFDGNWLWSAQITLFVWFVAATIFLIRRNAPSFWGVTWWDRVRSLTCWSFFTVHLFCGLVWLNFSSDFDWWTYNLLSW